MERKKEKVFDQCLKLAQPAAVLVQPAGDFTIQVVVYINLICILQINVLFKPMNFNFLEEDPTQRQISINS